jgi:hypothetical protein
MCLPALVAHLMTIKTQTLLALEADQKQAAHADTRFRNASTSDATTSWGSSSSDETL